MKKILLLSITSIILWFIPAYLYAQVVTLGTTNNFALFTTVGAITNVGLSQVTGDVGSNIGGSTAFGNVNGNMHDQDTSSASGASALLTAYGQLNTAIPTLFHASPFGNGDTFVPGVHRLASASTLTQTLYLNAQGNGSAVFIIQVQGALSVNSNTKVKLINGAKACNVYWKVEGEVTINTGSSIKGTIVANGGAIHILTNDTLEGRALAINGAIDINTAMIYTPVGCGVPALIGPALPNIGGLMCYTLFSSIGPVSNSGITNVVGDVGSNSTTTTGFDTLLVVGKVHAVPDGSTNQAAIDLLAAYNQLNALQADILLLYPNLFGRNLVLTPHTYLMNGATSLTDTLFLNAMGNPDAKFIIKCYGAFSASANSRVILINGTQAKNVYWMVNGAVSIMANSIFNGTIICNSGAMDLTSGVQINGRALTTTGALTTASITAIMPPGCGPDITSDVMGDTICLGDTARFIVNAIGVGLTYQWRKGNIDLVNGLRIQGVTNDTLIIYPTLISDSGSNYHVIVSGVGVNDTSNFVILKIETPPNIIIQPLNKTTCIGVGTQFITQATGKNLTYQWRKGNVNLINGLNISGADSSVLIINPTTFADTASNYHVIVSGDCGVSDTSDFVKLQLSTPPIITVEPTNKIACLGSSVNFAVTALGSGLIYQWRKGNVNLINGLNISGVDSSVLTINPNTFADTASNYRVIVSGTCGVNDTSNFVQLQLNPLTAITVEPANKSVCLGNPENFSVTAIGSALTYQWRKGNINLINGPNISGADSSVLTINPTTFTDTASTYHVIVSGSCGVDTSNFVELRLNTAPIITVEPVNKTACLGSSISFSVTVTGSGLTYQWRRGNVNLLNGITISGADSNVLVINPTSFADTASNYHVIVSGGCGVNDTSNFVQLLLNTVTMITVEPTNKIVCPGSAASYVVTAKGSGLSYTWHRGNLNLVNGLNISGADSSVLTINPTSFLDTASNYYVVVSGVCGVNDTSNFVKLQLDTAPVITVEPTDKSACVGDVITLNVTASGNGLSYQWHKGNVLLSNGGNLSGVLTAQLTINPTMFADTASNYYVVVKNNCGLSDTSTLTSVLVSTPLVVAISSNSPVCKDSIIRLSTPLIAGAGYNWTGPNGFASSASSITITNATTVHQGLYNVIVTQLGCASQPASTLVEVKDCLLSDFFIPEGFSPNGDGINDKFVIRGINQFPGNAISIYSRWGVKVYSASPYISTWDGTSNSGVSIGGDALPIGTYFYILDLGNGEKVIQGTIYLNR